MAIKFLKNFEDYEKFEREYLLWRIGEIKKKYNI